MISPFNTIQGRQMLWQMLLVELGFLKWQCPWLQIWIVRVSPYAMQALLERRHSCSFGHPFLRGWGGQQHDHLIHEVRIKMIVNRKPQEFSIDENDVVCFWGCLCVPQKSNVKMEPYEKVIGLHTLLVRASGGREGRLIPPSMLQLVVCAIRWRLTLRGL